MSTLLYEIQRAKINTSHKHSEKMWEHYCQNWHFFKTVLIFIFNIELCASQVGHFCPYLFIYLNACSSGTSSELTTVVRHYKKKLSLK
jgi:hypothetical protein